MTWHLNYENFSFRKTRILFADAGEMSVVCCSGCKLYCPNSLVSYVLALSCKSLIRHLRQGTICNNINFQSFLVKRKFVRCCYWLRDWSISVEEHWRRSRAWVRSYETSTRIWTRCFVVSSIMIKESWEAKRSGSILSFTISGHDNTKSKIRNEQTTPHKPNSGLPCLLSFTSK